MPLGHERRTIYFLFALTLALAAMPPSDAVAQSTNPNPTAIEPPPPEKYVAGEVIVRLRPGTSEEARDQTLAVVNGVFLRDLELDDVILARVPVGTEIAAAESLEIDPNVVFAEPNGLLQASATETAVE